MVLLSLTGVSLLPVLAALLSAAIYQWTEFGDYALIDMRVRDVFSSEIPLVGTYSRYGWNHPGPLMYWLMAPVARVLGGSSRATIASHALFQGVAVIWLVRLAWVKGGSGACLLSLATIGLTWGAAGSWLLLQPWNPYFVLPYFVLFLFQAWFIAHGDPTGLVGATFVANLIVQSHVGYAPIVAVVGAASALVLFVDRKTADRRAGWRRPVITSAAVTLACWVAPLAEEVRRYPNGSVMRTIRFFADPDEPPTGLRRAAGHLATELAVPPPWLGGRHRSDQFTGDALPRSAAWLLVPALAGAVALLLARNREVTAPRRLVLASGAMVILGIVVLSRVTGPQNPYLFLWRSPLAILLVLSIVALAVSLAPVDWRRRADGLAVGACAVCVVLPSLGLAAAVVDDGRDREHLEASECSATSITRALESSSDPQTEVLVRTAGSPLRGSAAAIVNEMDRAGRPVRVDEGYGFQWGWGREAAVGDVDEVWYVIEEGQFIGLVSDLPGAQRVVVRSPFSAIEEAELEGHERSVADSLVRSGRGAEVSKMGSELVEFGLGDVAGVDPQALARLARFNNRRVRSGDVRCAVIGFPADRAPAPVAPVLPPALW